MPGMEDFTVIKPLGSGAFATVSKVQRKSDKQVYALKRVHIGKMGKRELGDTLNEVRLLASIQHHNIVRFYEAFLDKNNTELAVIMEFCGSGDLAGKISRHKSSRRYIEEKQIWAYLVQLCDALALLHERGIMHRDIKGANVFMAEDGSLKVGDMNVSKTTKGKLLSTQIGTPLYMSPETWGNIPYSYPSDMWSVGCLMYELCALRPPFLANSFPALKRAIQSGRYPSLPSVYSYDLSSVIGRLLRLQPRERPSAREVLNLPEVLKWKERGLECTPSTPRVGNVDLLNTIVVPRKLSMISAALPESNYPGEESSVGGLSRASSRDSQMERRPPREQRPAVPSREQLHHRKGSEIRGGAPAAAVAAAPRVPSRGQLLKRQESDVNKKRLAAAAAGAIPRIPSRGKLAVPRLPSQGELLKRQEEGALRRKPSSGPSPRVGGGAAPDKLVGAGGVADRKGSYMKERQYQRPSVPTPRAGNLGPRLGAGERDHNKYGIKASPRIPAALIPPSRVVAGSDAPDRGYRAVAQNPYLVRAKQQRALPDNRHAPPQYRAQRNYHEGYLARGHNNAYAHQKVAGRAGRAAVAAGPSWWG